MNRKMQWMWVALLVLLSGACKNDSNKDDCLTPLSEHIVGRWSLAISEEKVNGVWVEVPNAGHTGHVDVFRADGTCYAVSTSEAGESIIGSGTWSVDEQTRVLTLFGVNNTVSRLTADEMVIEGTVSVDGETYEESAGEFRWTFRRTAGTERTFVEKLLGRWNFTNSYIKQDGEWVETDEANPDEFWIEYHEDGSMTVYVSASGEVSQRELDWRINVASDELFVRQEGETDWILMLSIHFEDDDTYYSFYMVGYDPNTGEYVPGEFRDRMERAE